MGRAKGDGMKETIADYIVPVTQDGRDVMFDFLRATRLIRCKDCKYNSNTEGNYVNCDLIPQMFGKTPDDNYCSDAEPKETNDH